MEDDKRYINCKKLLIEVNQKCNLNCTYCFYRDYGRNNQELSIRKLKETLNDLPNVKEFYLTGGECFLAKDIGKMIKYLSELGEVITFSNGTVLNTLSKQDLIEIVNLVSRFIITYDSNDFENFKCRRKLDETFSLLKKMVSINSNKLEVKVCITKYNYSYIDEIFKYLIDNGVKNLSTNLVFDIKNSEIKHEVDDIQDLRMVFSVIDKYKDYFNKNYIEVLKEFYLNNIITEKYPCIADREYLFMDCLGDLLICPGNKKQIGDRGDWKKCFSKECINEWEMFY